jgi:glycosyltransferase involved in cell wall biosynthesis
MLIEHPGGSTLAAAVELPSITIVTPCLNAADTVDEALESVRSQDYPRLEHVVVDGGSEDGTLERLEAAEGITWVSERDRGRFDAANRGLGIASGEVVAFLNADDRYEPGALHAVGETFARRPQTMWITGYCRIVDRHWREIRRPITEYKNLLLRSYSFPLLLTQDFVSDPATFARRSALAAAGPIDDRYPISHDYDLWLRVAKRWDPVVLRRYLASFRMMEGTVSMSTFERQFREHAEIARIHGDGHRTAVAANAVISRLIVTVYRALRARRRLGSASAA